jgi:hypothetical protein
LPEPPGGYLAGPDGAGAGPGAMMRLNGRVVALGGGGPAGGELMGRIGLRGTPFVLGSQYSGVPKQDGKLYVCIAPSPWNCPSAGNYQVTLTTGPFGEELEGEDE